MSGERHREKIVYQQIAVKTEISRQFDKAGVISAFSQTSQQRLQMGAVTQFAFNISDQTLSGQCREDALVIDFEHIGIQLCKNAEHTEQSARTVLQTQPDARESAGSGQIPQQDIGEQARKEGFPDLRASALKKVANGLTSLEEANRITVD
mgnify:CR=1 FL=1